MLETARVYSTTPDTTTATIKTKVSTSTTNRVTQTAKKEKITSKIRYFFKSFFVTHPRLLSLFLLYKSVWPRALALVDIYTDIQVTIDLYETKSTTSDEKKEYLILFALSVLFISFSFIMLWSVSLRFVETFWNKYKTDDRLTKSNTKKSNSKATEKGKTNSKTTKLKRRYKKLIEIIMNICLTLYLFPPIGCLVVTFYEIYQIFYDIYCGLYSFIKGEILIIDKDSKETAFKQFRRIVEFFGETIPQLLIQIYMFITNIEIDQNDLYLSICVSTFHLFYHCYKLKQESKYHGMSFAEYSINVLHLGAIPISKLVPRLPAISKGKVLQVNFGDFIMDKQSIGTIIQGLSSPLSKLNTIRITIGSIKNLDIESCHTLGAFLKRKNINVIISQTVDSHEILKMFKMLDKQNNGYLNRKQFDNACKILTFTNVMNDSHDVNNNNNASKATGITTALTLTVNEEKKHHIDGNEIKEKEDDDDDDGIEVGYIDSKQDMELYAQLQWQSTVSAVFDRLTIRKKYNSTNSDRVYFIDFYDSFTETKQKNFIDSKYDITSINCPIHFVFEYLSNCVKHYFLHENEKSQELIDLGQLTQLPQTPNEWSSRIGDLSRLFHFLLGLGRETELSLKNRFNVLITIILTKFKLSKIMIKNGKASNTLIDGEIKLSNLILWFLDKVLVELIKLESMKHLIKQRYNFTNGNVAPSPIFGKIDNSLNSIELALQLKCFSLFAILGNKIVENDNSKLTDIDVIDWNKLTANEWNATDIGKLFYCVIHDGSPKLMCELLQLKQIQIEKYKLLQILAYATLQATAPNNSMCLCPCLVSE